MGNQTSLTEKKKVDTIFQSRKNKKKDQNPYTIKYLRITFEVEKVNFRVASSTKNEDFWHLIDIQGKEQLDNKEAEYIKSDEYKNMDEQGKRQALLDKKFIQKKYESAIYYYKFDKNYDSYNMLIGSVFKVLPHEDYRYFTFYAENSTTPKKWPKKKENFYQELVVIWRDKNWIYSIRLDYDVANHRILMKETLRDISNRVFNLDENKWYENTSEANDDFACKKYVGLIFYRKDLISKPNKYFNKADEKEKKETITKRINEIAWEMNVLVKSSSDLNKIENPGQDYNPNNINYTPNNISVDPNRGTVQEAQVEWKHFWEIEEIKNKSLEMAEAYQRTDKFKNESAAVGWDNMIAARPETRIVGRLKDKTNHEFIGYVFYVEYVLNHLEHNDFNFYDSDVSQNDNAKSYLKIYAEEPQSNEWVVIVWIDGDYLYSVKFLYFYFEKFKDLATLMGDTKIRLQTLQQQKWYRYHVSQKSESLKTPPSPKDFNFLPIFYRKDNKNISKQNQSDNHLNTHDFNLAQGGFCSKKMYKNDFILPSNMNWEKIRSQLGLNPRDAIFVTRCQDIKTVDQKYFDKCQRMVNSDTIYYTKN